MGVSEWFQTFCAELQVADKGTISSRYKAITQRLNTDFWGTSSDTAHSLYVGSYGRNTATAGFSDLDMIFELPVALYNRYDQYQGNGQSALLQAVRLSMMKTYSSSDVGADGQVVQVHFTDGITFEVVPVFTNKEKSYNHPDANAGGSWKVTNPRPEIAAIRDRNSSCNGNLIPLCRMMRAWKSQWNVPIGGLLIDTLAYQFIENWTYRDKSFLYYDFMSRDFFEFMTNIDISQEYWKAPGSAQWVKKRGPFQSKARDCYRLSLVALEYAKANQDWSAKKTWREIFGTSFPS